MDKICIGIALEDCDGDTIKVRLNQKGQELLLVPYLLKGGKIG